MLKVALQEFVTCGFRGASVRVIAKKAAVSTRTVYNRYPDKFALFAACLEMTSREIESQVVDQGGGDIKQRLVDFAVRMQMELSSARSLQIARLIYRESGTFKEVQEIARVQFYRYQVRPVESILADAGYPSERAGELAAHFVVLALGRWQRRVIFDEGGLAVTEMKRHAEAVTALFLGGCNSLDGDSGTPISAAAGEPVQNG